jgi:hypothetical protein
MNNFNIFILNTENTDVFLISFFCSMFMGFLEKLINNRPRNTLLLGILNHLLVAKWAHK